MKKLTRNILIYVLVLMFVLILPAGSSVNAETPPYSDEYQQVPVYVNGKKVSDIAFSCKGNIYIKISTLKRYGDTSKLSIDTSGSKISFKASELNLNLGDDEAAAFIRENAGTCYIPIKNFNDENGNKDYFVSTGPVAQLAKFAWAYSQGNLYIMDYKSGNVASAKSVGDAIPSLRNGSINSLSSGEKVFIQEETRSFYKVSKADGNSYYINKSDVEKADDLSLIPDFEYKPRSITYSYPMNLVFLNLADGAERTPLPPEDMTGVDVLCPAWLHQTVNGNGTVKQICDYGYVQLAHQKGAKVWIMANNCFVTKGSTNYTTEVMSSESLTNQVLAQYLLYACMYEADGINIDYEDLRKSDREIFSNFMTKLGGYCAELGLTLSVDTSTPESYNTMYDWTALSSACDYIVPMTYVEHMASSVGSISSYGWYSNRIGKMINQEGVPKEKILMGVPFFTRYYYLTEYGGISGSGTLTMKSARTWVESAGAVPYWDNAAKQYVADYTNKDGKHVKMWLEDPSSQAARAAFVLDSGIAGSACWALDQQEVDTLKIYEDIYRRGVAPEMFFTEKY